MTPASPERLRERRRLKEQFSQLAKNEQAVRDRKLYEARLAAQHQYFYPTNSLDLQRLG